MTDKLKISHSTSGEGREQFLDFTLQVLDKKLLDHDAKFQIIRKVTALDTRPVNAEAVIHEESFRMNSDSASFRLHASDLNSYNYAGQLIQISLIAKCTVNDGIIFDTKHSINFQIEYEPQDSTNEDAELLIQPKDDFNMLKNYRVLPTANKIYIILALLLSVPLVFISLPSGLLGLFTDIRVVPFINGDSSIWVVLVAIISAIALWLFIHYQLRQYMTFNFKKLPNIIAHNSRIAMRDMIKGKSKIALNNITLRVVACNIERGQYRRGHGTKTRTVSFSNPIRGIILYEKTISNVPPKIGIDLFVNGTCDFSKIFSCLYPAQMTGKSHGLDIYWEIQLIHPKFLDHELVGKNNIFELGQFYAANNNSELNPLTDSETKT